MHRMSESGKRSGQFLGHWLVVLGALAGLFAMHGLSDHGASHHGYATETQVGAGGTTLHMGMGSDDRASSGTGVPELGDAQDSGGPLLMGLCLAVLAAAVLLLFSRWLPQSSLLWRRLQSATRTWVARARAPDPPGLYRLSIQRC